MNCIGLFGTCGGSQWREPFISAFEAAGVAYFNPQKDDWNPDDAAEEARHLAEDDLILFPVTGETYGTGSLAETGFSIAQAMKNNHRMKIKQNVIIYIEDDLADHLKEDAVAYKESIRARKLVKAHLNKVDETFIHIVSNLDDMLALSLPILRGQI